MKTIIAEEGLKITIDKDKGNIVATFYAKDVDKIFKYLNKLGIKKLKDIL